MQGGSVKGSIVYYDENTKDEGLRSLLDKKADNELITITGKLFPIPISGELGDRQCIFIVGKSGSGKSYWMAEYGKLYMKMYPNNKIHLFSNKTSESPIDVLNANRIPLTEEALTQIFDNFTKINNCLIIFDDVDVLPDKKIEILVQKIQNQIYMLARSQKVTMLHAKHIGLDKDKSKIALAEMLGCVIMTKGISAHVARTILQKYIGIDKEAMNKILNLKSRWVYINTDDPKFYVSENKICLL